MSTRLARSGLDRKGFALTPECGAIGVDVRPDWSDRGERESLTGAQWR
jgi:hypothetical protein